MCSQVGVIHTPAPSEVKTYGWLYQSDPKMHFSQCPVSHSSCSLAWADYVNEVCRLAATVCDFSKGSGAHAVQKYILTCWCCTVKDEGGFRLKVKFLHLIY